MNATEPVVLSGFWQENDLGPLGVKVQVPLDIWESGYGCFFIGFSRLHFVNGFVI